MAEFKINLSRCHLDDVLGEPPLGHRGCWATQQQPEWRVGDTIIFTVYQDVEQVRGVVIWVDSPGACKREDMKDFRQWYCTHWIVREEVRNEVALLAGMMAGSNGYWEPMLPAGFLELAPFVAEDPPSVINIHPENQPLYRRIGDAAVLDYRCSIEEVRELFPYLNL